MKRTWFDRIFGPRKPKKNWGTIATCVNGHPLCLGPDIAANRDGCRMQTWSDVG